LSINSGDLAEFLEEFGIDFSDNPLVADVELRRINQVLEHDRVEVLRLTRALAGLKGNLATAEVRPSDHEKAAALAENLGGAQKKYNNRIELARKFGFIPKVYRGRSGEGKRVRRSR
jgi:hypothetical protein